MTLAESRSNEHESLSIAIEPDLRWLASVRMVIRRNLPPLPSDQAALFHGAVTEILVNAIDAHRRQGSDAPVTIRLDLGPQPIITIVDGGPGFDPSSLGSMEPSPENGASRGLAIARAICPDLRIESSASGTKVIIPYPTDRSS